MTRFPRRAIPIAAVVTLLLSGCLGTASQTPDPTIEATADPVASEAASATPEATVSPTPDPEPSEAAATAEPTFDDGGELSVAPNAEADALFLERDECTNRQDGYIVEFPEDWYTNTEIARFPACVWFSPTFYEVVDQTQAPDEIAIEIFWIEGAYRWETELLSTEEVRVGGQLAVRVESAGTRDDPNAGTSYAYAIRLGPTIEAGPTLVARTDTDMGGDYELNKAVLDRILSTIEFIGVTQ